MPRFAKARRRFSLYAGFVVGCFLLAAALALVDLRFLERAGEYADLDALIEEQAANHGLYNGAAHSLADYKYAVYRKRAPEIVAIGTSRAMQLRDEFFTGSFYNLGGLVQGVDQAFALADRLFARVQPKVVIFFLDFWTFRAVSAEDLAPGPVTRPRTGFHDGMGSVNRLTVPLHLLARGALPPDAAWRILTGREGIERDGLARYGVFALLDERGFAPDGSYVDFAGLRSGRYRGALEGRWQGDFESVDRGLNQFRWGRRASAANLAKLELFVAQMAARGIRVVLVVPPVAPAVLARMAKRAPAYAYIDEWRRELARRLPGVYDFHDAESLGAGDCEFLDGLHGGEVVAMRILRAIAAGEPAGLGARIEVARLDRWIVRYAGRVLTPESALDRRRAGLIERAAGACPGGAASGER